MPCVCAHNWVSGWKRMVMASPPARPRRPGPKSTRDKPCELISPAGIESALRSPGASGRLISDAESIKIKEPPLVSRRSELRINGHYHRSEFNGRDHRWSAHRVV